MTDRPYLALIQESVQHDDVTFEEIAPNYLYRAKKEQKSFIMHDVEIGLNNSASLKIARSKSGTYSVLKKAGIPAVEHYFLLNDSSRFSKSNSYHLAAGHFHSFGENMVLKQDDGSQGKNVYQIHSAEELQSKLKTLFSLEVNACLSPYYPSTYEYRIIMLKDEPKLFLAKERTTSWKHNLIGGSLSKEVPAALIPILSKIATDTSTALELDFCSVDILDTSHGLLVLEVNEQVMLDEYVKGDPNRKEKVSAIYREAILERFTRY
ncbi:ATP-grasp domain-containing protein [Halalkalibacter alkalisediminis]|uniref:RimK family alpha-L-glutamate ligase n=1 Tax=Halalkalibacter alkalisediminis TaxID=935616 RepID=A0ABV6NJ76_9BACI|nr:hypothetical protein [Halalkalibacter alkalisediminis]